MEILITVFLTVVFMLFFANYLVTRAVSKCERENQLKNRATFVIVLHNWFVRDKAFTVAYSDAPTIEQARAEAKVLCYDNDSDFNHCAYTVIPIMRKSELDPNSSNPTEPIQFRHC